MDIKQSQKKLTEWFSKYKYVALIAGIGLLFLLIPGKSEDTPEPAVTQQQITQQVDVEQQLSQVLSKVHGAGEVEIMLTVSTGERTVYQANTYTNTDADSTEIRHEFITISDAQRAQEGLIVQIDPPVYLGAIVVCEGADSPAVCLALTEAVSKVTGLGADRISVLKMN